MPPLLSSDATRVSPRDIAAAPRCGKVKFRVSSLEFRVNPKLQTRNSKLFGGPRCGRKNKGGRVAELVGVSFPTELTDHEENSHP